MSPDQPADKLEHLKLPHLLSGNAVLRGRSKFSEITEANKADVRGHSGLLRNKALHLKEQWEERRRTRPTTAPQLPPEVPVLVKIDPSFNIDSLRSSFDFEVVSEQDDGFIIVAAKDLSFKKLLLTIQKFAASRRGGGSAASLHDLSDDDDQAGRLRRILSEDLFANWNELGDTARYTVDISIECLGTIRLPSPVAKKPNEKAEKFIKRKAKYDAKFGKAYEAWDEIKRTRESEFESFLAAYDGTILEMSEEQTVHKLPDSFSARIEITGAGLKDLVFNYPFIFEVSSPDTFAKLPAPLIGPDGQITATFNPPHDDAPHVCVMDSGIQQNHPILEKAIAVNFSKSYIDGNSADVGDQVLHGHGTRVAGAILFPTAIPRQNQHQLPFWIINRRVLNNENQMPLRLYPPRLMDKVIREVRSVAPQTRLFSHSINTFGPCLPRHMSAWAATIDQISFTDDVLVIQSAGNLPEDDDRPFRRGIRQHLANGSSYPDYLLEPSSRIANPAQSFNALTVGSIARKVWTDGNRSSFARDALAPSAFSRSGLGLWGSIKPDVVEFGGDYICDAHGENIAVVRDTCPELLRATNTSPAGPLFDSDDVGTSYAAPKVTSIAAELQRMFSDQPTLLFRALIALSARLPEWANSKIASEDGLSVLRTVGYGLPDKERATSNTAYRATLYTEGERRIKAREVQIFQVPIPSTIRSQANDQEILVEVCLSFAASPRRTRQTIRRYLGVWVDWAASTRNESVTSFRRRVSKEGATEDLDGEGEMPWTLGNRSDLCQIQGARRNQGSLQKDWAVVKAFELPETFCIAVVGHPGWDTDPDAFARYSLAVSFEAINQDLEIYEALKIEVDNLEVPVGVSST
jgi:hypothetical protein